MKIVEVYKSAKVRIHGCNEEFKSKTDAIVYLLKQGKLTKVQIAERLNVSPQQVYYASMKIKKEKT